MYERFTDRARKVMQLANQEALRLNYPKIDTRHILLGLIKEGSGVAANVLKNLDVDLRKIRLEVEKRMHSCSGLGGDGNLPQSLFAKRAINYAMEEAQNLNHNYVGTEHILLGLLREQEGGAAIVLMNLGLKIEEVREEVLNLLERPTTPAKTEKENPMSEKTTLQEAREAAERSMEVHELATVELPGSPVVKDILTLCEFVNELPDQVEPTPEALRAWCKCLIMEIKRNTIRDATCEQDVINLANWAFTNPPPTAQQSNSEDEVWAEIKGLVANVSEVDYPLFVYAHAIDDTWGIIKGAPGCIFTSEIAALLTLPQLLAKLREMVELPVPTWEEVVKAAQSIQNIGDVTPGTSAECVKISRGEVLVRYILAEAKRRK